MRGHRQEREDPLCDALGLWWCMIAVSPGQSEQGHQIPARLEHREAGGQVLSSDATFDNSLSQQGLLRYDYFNLMTSAFSGTIIRTCFLPRALLHRHRPLFYKESRLSLHKRSKRFATGPNCRFARNPALRGGSTGGADISPSEVLSELVHAPEAEA